MNKTLNYLTLLFIVIIFPDFVIQYFISGKPVSVFTYIGLGLMIPGFILLIIARLQLGSSFSIEAQANQLVTKGLYKKFRHPIYYFGTMLIIGTYIFSMSFFSSRRYMPFLLLLFIIIQFNRIKKEEKVLKEKFGDEYLAYRKNTWF
ncbi:MAG: DUF1295 domain-containing protein [Ferruginibacter sp.]